ncbi:MAG: glutamine--fructose-6-phosphate transaminase (isomerizing) [Euryarchaeota archaeon]|nr:glutamine--fructose-6-phosphate transaminase (isomerizing) [Euryarchaeota archaeon]
MCGIFGCISTRKCAYVIHEALRRLAYRGYDSVGITTIDNKQIYIKKDMGKIEEVHQRLNLDDLPGNAGIGHCLHPDTLVQLADGSTAKISSLNEECFVLSYDLKKSKFVKAKAICFKHKAPKNLHKIKTSSAEIICTERHRLFVIDGNGKIIEKEVKDIRKEDRLIFSQFTFVKEKSKLSDVSERYVRDPIVYQRLLSNTKIENNTEYVYDLEVPNYENFIANGIISHNSRWATHGAPTKINAHPHTDCENQIVVAHNGIIQNYIELKEELIKEGHVFRSETDTEVIPHLIEKFNREGFDFETSVVKACHQLKGSYAMAIINAKEPDKLIVVRKESPLVIGIGNNETFAASDIPAFLKETNKVIILNDGELGILTSTGVVIKNFLTGEVVKKKIETVRWAPEMAEKAGYAHFMLKEIHEQPFAIRETLRVREDELKDFIEFLNTDKKIYVIACGTSYHAALAAKYAFAKLAKLSVDVIISSEFKEAAVPTLDENSLVLAISQSGETADTLAAIRAAKEKGAKILAITNVVGSSITRESDCVCYTHAGPEIGVAATKTFAVQLIDLFLIAVYLAKIRKTLPKYKIKELLKQLERMPDIVHKVIDSQETKIMELAEELKDVQDVYFLGRGISFATASEGALKFKEISYIHSECYPGGELKHGPLALIEKGVPVIVVIPPGDNYDKMIGNIEEVKARGAKVIALASEKDEKIAKLVDDVIKMPEVDEISSPIPYVAPLQLVAYYVSTARGLDPDKPRHLAKSVTVE